MNLGKRLKYKIYYLLLKRLNEMKYLKKYKIFENYNKFGSKTITESEFDKIRKESCKNWTKVETELFRGMPDLGDYVFVDPKLGDFRSSIEDTNIHLELMSNLPSWKDYPRYDRCVIGGSPGAVGSYGDVIYEMIPFDDVQISVCPFSTIWESFGNEDSEWGGDIYLVEHFLDSVGLDLGWIQIGGETLETKLKSLNDFDLSLISIDNFITDCSLVLNKRKEDINGVDCFNFINEHIFNPSERGFELKTYDENFKIENKKQIWTEGPVLLIKGKLS
jgi:hypothetical protein